MKPYLVLFFFLTSFMVWGQDIIITGKVLDADGKFPLESATIYAETLKDSTLVTYSISDKKGDFVLSGFTAEKKLRLNISYTGYSTFTDTITINNPSIPLGTINLKYATEALDGVVVKASRAPVTIKKDTLEFNVASFKTKKDATVEDLLRELPGVEVDPEGAITVNGKPVNQILVNGKPFFGDDPTIATRNLTKEIVDKIQVVDTKTESEAFTGEAGDDQNKTINITIDEEKNKGIFGRVAAGGGTDERFEYAGLVNYFDNDVRISVLGGGNNTNSPGFSFGELNKMFGGASSISVNSNGAINFDGRNFGGGQGIVNSRVGGANYADDFGEKTEITADYFYSASNSFNDEQRNRENILPDDRFFSNSISRTTSEADGHSANLRFKTEIDSTLLIDIRPEFDFSTGNSQFSNSEETFRENGDLSNEAENQRNTQNERRNFQSSISVTKKYGSNGGFLRLRFTNQNDLSENDLFVNSTTEIFGDTPGTIVRNQITEGRQDQNRYTITSEVNYPIIADTLFITGEYSYRTSKREDLREVFDFDQNTQEFSIFNTDQSTDFTNFDRSSRPEIGIRYNDRKLRASASVGYVLRTLESNDALRGITFENDFNAVEASANLSYQFTQKLSMYSGYYLENQAPSVNQLSPFIDISNPLNTVQGNPNLRPSNQHNLYFGLNNYDFTTQSGFYSNFNGNLTNDQVVARTTVDENFVRNTSYDNVDGVYSIGGGGGYNKSKKIDSIKTIKYNVGFYASRNRSVNFNNDVQYASTTTSFSPNIGITFNWKDVFELRPSYDINLNRNTFDLAQFENINYTSHEVRLRTTLTYPKKLEWSNDARYQYNPDVAPGFQSSAVFWNSSLAYSAFNDKGVFTLKAFDLLRQNNNARRTSNQDFIQDLQSTVLQQYFMLSFSYKFNTLGKKGETSDDFWFD